MNSYTFSETYRKKYIEMTEEEKNALRNVFDRMLEEEMGYGQVTTLSIDHEIAKENLSYAATHRKDWTITIGFTEENYAN